ncbi:MAG: hypothetical protein MZV70_17300 [Desulfobacterales bacterium]|nr:hypothetical protein [Desulfobacterales bacterium]
MRVTIGGSPLKSRSASWHGGARPVQPDAPVRRLGLSPTRCRDHDRDQCLDALLRRASPTPAWSKGERLLLTLPHAWSILAHPSCTPRQFSRGRGKFMPIEHVPPAELPDDEYPCHPQHRARSSITAMAVR